MQYSSPPPLSRELKRKQTNKQTYFSFIIKSVNFRFIRKSVNYITFKMRWGNEMGANPFAPLIENTFLRAHSEKLDVNICFQAED